MEENKRISDLFERARTEAPKTSFEEVKKHVIAASAVGGVGILAKWAALSFKLKSIIMVSILSALTISGVTVASFFTNTPKKVAELPVSNTVQGEQNLEILREDGVEKTIIFDENDRVIELIVDSSGKLNSPSLYSTSEKPPVDIEELGLSTLQVDPIPSETPEIDPTFLKSEKNDRERRFKITEKTTQEELDEIRTLAENAGIKMNYNARIKKNIIKRLTMNWVLKSDETRSNWNVSVTGDDDFCVQVGWEEDENGKAIRFLSDKRIEVGQTIKASSGRGGSSVIIND